MRKIILIYAIITISCNSNKQEIMNIIHFDTDEFKKFEESVSIKKEDAWNLHKEFCKKNKEEWGGALYFVVNGNYVFSNYAKPKMNQASLNGIWVDAKTGKISIVKNKEEVIQSKGYFWRGELKN